MSRTRQAVAVLALGLALAGATTAVAAAATPPTATYDQTDQRRALYRSELERNLQLRNQRGQESLAQHELAAQRKALYHSELERTLAQRRAHGAIATQPVARTDPATPSPGVDVLATLVVGLVGGMVGGAAAVLGWSAATRWRLPRAAADT